MTLFMKGKTVPASQPESQPESQTEAAAGGLKRRQILSFLIGAPAAAAIVRAPVRPSFDDTIFFLADRFRSGAAEISAANERDMIDRINRYAQAMTVIPAADPRAIAAKLDTASWSVERGSHSIALGNTLVVDLIASAEADRETEK